MIAAAASEHSAKPDEVLKMIEAYFPSLPKIELNCRGVPRPGWDAWGNEAAKEFEFRYVRHADVPRFAAEGWELLPALDGTHHGEYSVLMRRVEQGAAQGAIGTTVSRIDFLKGRQDNVR